MSSQKIQTVVLEKLIQTNHFNNLFVIKKKKTKIYRQIYLSTNYILAQALFTIHDRRPQFLIAKISSGHQLKSAEKMMLDEFRRNDSIVSDLIQITALRF